MSHLLADGRRSRTPRRIEISLEPLGRSTYRSCPDRRTRSAAASTDCVACNPRRRRWLPRTVGEAALTEPVPVAVACAHRVPSDGDNFCLVIDDLGHLGRVFREADVDFARFEAVVMDLLEGQYSNPRRVVSFHLLQRIISGVRRWKPKSLPWALSRARAGRSPSGRRSTAVPRARDMDRSGRHGRLAKEA
jgi:hypothetical protein